MNRYKEIDKRLRQVSRGILLAAVLLAIAAYATPAESSSAAPQLMFVQSAEGLNVDTDSKTFRLVKVNQQALYFSDRPQRIAGHLQWPTFSRSGQRRPARTILAMTHRTPCYPSMSRESLTIRLLWSRSPTRLSTARIWSITTKLSKVRCLPAAVRRRCSSIGSVSAAVSGAASMAWVSAAAVQA